jgi:hypothetical protein
MGNIHRSIRSCNTLYVASGMLLLWFCLSAAGTARAELKLGPVEVHPGIGVGEVYRTNIFQTRSDEIDDWVTEVVPSLALDLPIQGRHEVHAGYKGYGYFFNDHGGEDHYDQVWDGHVKLDYPGGLAARLWGSVRDGTLERTSEVGRQRDYEQYLAGLDTAYSFADRHRIKAAWERNTWLFEKQIDEAEEYYSDTFSAALQARILSRTWASVDGGYERKDFYNSPANDSDIYSVFCGLEWDPKGKLRGELKGGYSWKRYDNDLAGRDSSLSTWALRTGLTWDIDRRTTVELTAQRGFVDDIDFLNESYTSSLYRLDVQRRIRPKIVVLAHAAYQNDSYNEKLVEPATGIRKDREDDSYMGGVGLIYEIQKWLYVRASWEYEKRDSDFKDYSFTEQRTAVRLGVQY